MKVFNIGVTLVRNGMKNEREERLRKARLLNAKILYKYLKRNNCFANFAKNTIKERLGNRFSMDDFSKKKVFKTLDKIGSIGQAFSWIGSPQGDQYWRKLDNDYCKFREHIVEQMKVIDPNTPTTLF
jgi:hypothetical protein